MTIAYRVGIVGLGTVAATHIHALEQMPQVEIVACCDCNPNRRLPGVEYYDDFQKMAQQAKLDAIHICLPHYLHLPAAEAFAAKGIPILCEKPVTTTVAQWEQLRQVEIRTKSRIAVCMQNRWNATFETLQQCIRQASSGPLIGIKAVASWSRRYSYYQQAPWRGSMADAGGGCMINQALHTLDLMLQIGGSVRSVKGQVCNLSDMPIEVEDTACAQITFTNGANGIFFGTVCNSRNASIELQVYCKNQTYTIKDYALWQNLPELEFQKELVVQDRMHSGNKAYYGASHVLLIEDFYRMLAGEGSRYVSVESAGQVIQLIQGIRTSSNQSKSILWEDIK